MSSKFATNAGDRVEKGMINTLKGKYAHPTVPSRKPIIMKLSVLDISFEIFSSWICEIAQSQTQVEEAKEPGSVFLS